MAAIMGDGIQGEDDEESGAIIANNPPDNDQDPSHPHHPLQHRNKRASKDNYHEGDEDLLIPPPPPPPHPPSSPEMPRNLRKRKKTAMTLRVVRKWLQKIIYAQAIGNIIRALPIFIMEKYLLMLLIFFEMFFLACGHFGTKMLRPYLILLYSIGMVAFTIPDLTVALTYARHSIYLPEAEAKTVFALYVVLVSILGVLNLVGGLLLGIRVCVSVMTLKNPKEYALVLQAAAWIGSFEGKDDESDKEAEAKKIQRRNISWSGTSGIAERPATVKYAGNEVYTSKYNVATFVPRVLYLQFSRLANLYTLCIVVLCMFSFSPVGPLSSVTPLLVVIGVSAGKELVEDIKRHRQDRMINSQAARVFRPSEGDFAITEWDKVKVGDVLLVNNNDMIPCDLLLLKTSRQDGRCYLETANLDGETNLKHRIQLPELAALNSPQELAGLSLDLECEGPNNSIYTFEGALSLKGPGGQSKWSSSGQIFSASGDMLLQRGTILRNTPWIYGLAVYTGKETKVEQNGVIAPMKRSFLEKSVNLKLIVLLLLQTIVCIVCAIGHNQWKLTPSDDSDGSGSEKPPDGSPTTDSTTPWYLEVGHNEHEFIYVSYLILYNTMIPLSMYVSMEMVRVTNATQVTGKNGIPNAATRSTSIMEELGQVQYLFADKTGTLTCNEMIVRKVSVVGDGVRTITESEDGKENGIVHTDSNGALNGENGNHSSSSSSSSPKAAASSTPTPTPPSPSLLTRNRHTISPHDECLMVMVVCNTVQVEKLDNGTYKYSTGSPDEEALVKCAARSGVVLVGRENTRLSVMWKGELKVFNILQTLEFNSYRKRMSVIAQREDDGAILLLCKGADSVIFSRLKAGALGTADTTKHINEFAGMGLRTLCLAASSLVPDEYARWSALYHEASLAVVHRAQRVDDAAEQIETNMVLLGAVGIEDRLQEGVSGCVASLQEAGVHVWVLTGDKTETAIAVATQASVLTQEMQVEILDEANPKALLKRIASLTEQLSLVPSLPPLVNAAVGFLGLDPLSLPPFLRPPPPPVSLALVLTDTSLPIALTKEVRYHFLSVAKAAAAVVCTRCSPIHKAKVVKLVAERSFLFGDGAVTLAIGDGANDVPMIRYAHIGVGISGREGMQAVLASDFSITQFAHLKPLLLVHGARCHKRIAKLVFYSFCKNVALSLSQFWFGFYNGFSGQMMFFDFLFTLFNSLFTAIPILTLSTVDQEHSDETLLRKPALYRTTSSNSNFSGPKFIGWLLLGIWLSVVVFFFPFRVMQSSSAKSGDLWVLGTSSYSVLVLALTIQVCLITSYWTIMNIVTVVGSVLFYVLFIVVYCQVFTNGIGVLGGMLGNGDFWMMMIVVPLLGVCPYVLYRLLIYFFLPTHKSLEDAEEEVMNGDQYELPTIGSYDVL